MAPGVAKSGIERQRDRDPDQHRPAFIPRRVHQTLSAIGILQFPRSQEHEEKNHGTICQEVLCLPRLSAGKTSPFELAMSRKTRDQKIARDHDRRDPRRNRFQRNQRNESRRNHDLVHQRIHQLSEIGDELVAARDLAIHEISDPGDDEQDQRGWCDRIASPSSATSTNRIVKPSRLTVRRFAQFMTEWSLERP